MIFLSYLTLCHTAHHTEVRLLGNMSFHFIVKGGITWGSGSQKTQGPNYPSMCNIFGLKIRPKLEIGFPKLSGVYSWMRTDIIWQEKWGHSSATSFLPYLWPGPLCTIFCSWLLGSHGFEVSWSWTLASIQPSWTIKEVQINNPSLSLRIKYHVQELQTLDNLPTNATYS